MLKILAYIVQIINLIYKNPFILDYQRSNKLHLYWTVLKYYYFKRINRGLRRFKDIKAI